MSCFSSNSVITSVSMAPLSEATFVIGLPLLNRSVTLLDPPFSAAEKVATVPDKRELRQIRNLDSLQANNTRAVGEENLWRLKMEFTYLVQIKSKNRAYWRTHKFLSLLPCLSHRPPNRSKSCQSPFEVATAHSDDPLTRSSDIIFRFVHLSRILSYQFINWKRLYDNTLLITDCRPQTGIRTVILLENRSV